MNHVDPSMSSGSSPGEKIAQNSVLFHTSAAAEQLGTSPSFVPPKSLVVNKRKLPAVLRHDIPELRIAGTAAESLIASPNGLWGVLHSDVGKQIQHRGRTVTILSVHQDTRLVVLIGEEQHRAFWIPRRAVNRRDFKEHRTQRLYDRGIKIAFVSPSFTGEPRPEAVTVSLPQWENLISGDLYRLTKSFGKYENRLISESFFPTFYRKMLRQRPTRQERKLLELKTRQKYAALKETLQEQVLRQIIADTRLPDDKQFAVYDVMALGQPIEQVAVTRQISVGSLENTVRRITTRVNQAVAATLQQRADAEIRP
jgi:hypothetical protein